MYRPKRFPLFKELFIGVISLCFAGCAANYGFDETEWNALTQQQRDDIELQARDRVAESHEYQREKDFLNQPIRANYGSRSNAY